MNQTDHSLFKTAGALLFFIILGLIAYFPGYWNGFVSDDEVYVLANPAVKNHLNLKEVFGRAGTAHPYGYFGSV